MLHKGRPHQTRQTSIKTCKWRFLDKFGGLTGHWQEPSPLSGSSAIGPTLIGPVTKRSWGDGTTISTVCSNKFGYDQVEKLENALLNHPLVIFPYLSDSLSTEDFQAAARFLDPLASRNLPQTKGYHTPILTKRESKQAEKHYAVRKRSTAIVRDADSEKIKNVNPNYDKSALEPQILRDQPKLRDITREFCEWVVNLDGKATENLSMSTIASLFAGSLEILPHVSTPISVVKLNQLPNVLQPDVGRKPSSPDRRRFSKLCGTSKTRTPYDLEQKPIRKRYGKWYLPKRLWKVQQNQQNLQPDVQEKDIEITSSIFLAFREYRASKLKKNIE